MTTSPSGRPTPPGPARRRSGATPATALRLAGGLLLVVGLVAAARWTPASPPAWRVAERFDFADAECATRLAAREVAPFDVPADRAEPLPVGELAGWFRLEIAAVCAANTVPAAACAGHAFAPGERVALPLGRGAVSSLEP